MEYLGLMLNKLNLIQQVRFIKKQKNKSYKRKNNLLMRPSLKKTNSDINKNFIFDIIFHIFYTLFNIDYIYYL